MKRSSKALLAVSGLLILTAAAWTWLHRPQPSDREQILAQLEIGRAAVQNRLPSAVMKIVSADYHDDNGTNVDRLHAEIIEALRGEGALTVTLGPQTVTVTGDNATTTGTATVTADGSARTYSHIALSWKKEDVTRFLIVPAKEWHIVSSSIPGEGGTPDF